MGRFGTVVLVSIVFFGTPLAFALEAGPSGWFADAGPNLLEVNPSAVALADLDNDSDIDAVVGFGPRFNSQGVPELQPLQLLINNGQALVLARGLAAHNVVSMALGDVSGDTQADLIVATLSLPGSGPANNTIYFGDGNGGFSARGTLGAEDLTALDLVDIDADGDFDAVTATGQELSLWVNQGGVQNATAGDFVQVQSSVISTGQIVDLATGDLGFGTAPDVYVALSGAPDRIFYNVSAGALADLGTTVGDGGNGRTAAALADMDGNGDLDVVVVGDLAGNPLEVFLRSGDNLQSTGQLFQASGDSTDLALADLNGDGNVDVMISERSQGSSANNVWFNRGNGLLDHSGQCFGDHQASTRIALADLNADGGTDALIAGSPLLGTNSGLPIAGQSGTTAWLNGAPVGAGNCCPAELINETATVSAPASKAFRHKGNAAPLADLLLLLDIRQRFMLPRPDGARLASHYETFGVEIVTLFLLDPGFHSESASRYSLWQPALAALNRGDGATVSVSAEMLQALDDFLTDLAARGGGALSQMISNERALIGPFDALQGITMDEFVDRTMGVSHTLFIDGFES